MANHQQKPRGERPAPERPVATHLLVRSRSARGFNRSGFRWHPEYQAVPLADFEAKAAAMNEANPGAGAKRTTAADLVRAIQEEPALDARLIGADEAEDYEHGRKAVAADDISPSELYQAVVALRARLGDLETKNAELERKLAERIGDLPPTRAGELPEGSRPTPPGR